MLVIVTMADMDGGKSMETLFVRLQSVPVHRIESDVKRQMSEVVGAQATRLTFHL
jgi:hypothetical protein